MFDRPTRKFDLNYNDSRAQTTARAVASSGLFSDGQWKCDCSPRLRAVLRQTGQGQNLGKWYYACAKPRARQCSFFLWKEKAILRDGSRSLAPISRGPSDACKTPTRQESKAIGLQTPVSNHVVRQITDPFTTPSPLPDTILYGELKNKPDGHTRCNQTKSDRDLCDEDVATHSLLGKERLKPPHSPASTPSRNEGLKEEPRTASRESLPKSSRMSASRQAPIFLDNTVFTDDAEGSAKIFDANARHTGPTLSAQVPHDYEVEQLEVPDSLDSSILAVLEDIPVEIGVATREKIKDLCMRQEMKLLGMTKGRNSLREIVKARDRKIQALETLCAHLKESVESERA